MVEDEDTREVDGKEQNDLEDDDVMTMTGKKDDADQPSQLDDDDPDFVLFKDT